VEKGTHRALWVMGTIAALIILWLLMRGKNVVNNVTNNTPAGYPSNLYNISSPGARNWTGGASGLPSIAPLDDGDCGCTSANGGNFFTSIQDMLNQFMNGASGAFKSYEDNVFSGYPSSVTQYFNNPVGASQSQSSRNDFASSNEGMLTMNSVGPNAGMSGRNY
jgi:hypothetical protein